MKELIYNKIREYGLDDRYAQDLTYAILQIILTNNKQYENTN